MSWSWSWSRASCCCCCCCCCCCSCLSISANCASSCLSSWSSSWSSSCSSKCWAVAAASGLGTAMDTFMFMLLLLLRFANRDAWASGSRDTPRDSYCEYIRLYSSENAALSRTCILANWSIQAASGPPAWPWFWLWGPGPEAPARDPTGTTEGAPTAAAPTAIESCVKPANCLSNCETRPSWRLWPGWRSCGAPNRYPDLDTKVFNGLV